jgi:hypothetical protein
MTVVPTPIMTTGGKAMNLPSPQKLSMLSMLLVLFWTVAPVGADHQTIDSRIDLHLQEALTLARAQPEPSFAAAIDGLEEAGAPTVVTALQQRLQLARYSREAAQEAQIGWQQADAAQAQAASGKRGFGRWLKKHWYVPVLVGAAVIVATADDGSDGPDDIED